MAEIHDDRCQGRAEHAHHICYRSQIPEELYWTVIENGISLSNLCHTKAHKTHNGNLAIEDIFRAQITINKGIQAFRDRTKKPYPFIPPFMDKSA
jgi:hypothetical protein